MLDKKEWLDQAQKIAVGRSIRVRHVGCSRRDNLVITNSPDKYWAYCHACKGYGVQDKTHVLRAPVPKAPRQGARPPEDLKVLSASDLPQDTIQMLIKFMHSKGVSPLMFWDQCFNMWYSESQQRLCIGKYDKPYLGRDITGSSNMKWCKYKDAPSLIFSEDLELTKAVVLTEDLFSAVKVKQYLHLGGVPATVGSLGGTSITGRDILQIMDLEPERVILYLDGDPAGWAGAREIRRRLSQVLPKGTQVYSTTAPQGLDPKDLDGKSILRHIEQFVLGEVC